MSIKFDAVLGKVREQDPVIAEGGITPVGAYSADTEYSLGDVVSYNGNSYICKATSTGNLPTNTTYWVLLSEKGEQGDQGEQGETGPKGDTGDTGAQGSQGIQGVQGEQGVKGDTGTGITENDDGFELTGGTTPRTLKVTGGDVSIEAGTPTKGNLLAGDGTDLGVLSVGSNDKLLVADSAEDRGMKWVDDIATINFIIDGGGSAIATGIKGDIQIDFDCEIQQATLLADQSGDIVVDIWKDSYANHPATVADTITASAKPTLSSASKSQDSSLTGWTKAISAGDHLRINVDSASTVERVTLALKIKKKR